MSSSVQPVSDGIDRFRLTRWMNARKRTAHQVAAAAGMSATRLEELLAGAAAAQDDERGRLARVLDVPEAALAGSTQGTLVVVRGAAELEATRRPIQRDGIHFYDYYTMAAGPGAVAPVILDILCPADRLPALNRGHQEPALTVNLGPGDIRGRWAEDLDVDSWRLLAANRAEPRWILGDSYLEPAWRPHTYALADETPARIVSYTVDSPLASLVERTNAWDDARFSRVVEPWRGRSPAAAMLRLHMARRGFDAEALSHAARVPLAALTRALGGGEARFGDDARERLGDALAVDPALFVDPPPAGDRYGKVHAAFARSIASRRRFGRYEVASMAASARAPDIVGLFLRVADPATEADLVEHGDCHYLVTGGAPTVSWAEGGVVRQRRLAPWDSLWVAPYVAHGFGGEGALLKLGCAAGVGSDELRALARCDDVAWTLERGRRAEGGWG